MDDLEQQIRAWADATVAAAPGTSGPPDDAVWSVPGRSERRGRVRPLLVAAVVVVLVGIGLVAVGRDDDAHVRTGSAGSVTTTTFPRSPGAEDIASKVLFVGGPGDAPIGTIGAASTPAQFTRLWSTLRPLPQSRGFGERGPVPDVDFDHMVVVTLVVAGDGCPTEFAGWTNTKGKRFITPRFDRPAPTGPCDRDRIPIQYVVALDWDTMHPSMIVQLPGPDGGQGDELLMRRSQRAQVWVELETDIGEIHAGDQFDLVVAVQNATGEPIRTTGCGAPFAVGLERDGERFVPGSGWCHQEFDIPTGGSSYEVTLLASRLGCTTDSTAPYLERCQADGSPLDLDPGEYEMVLVGPDGFDAVPPTRTIEVVPRGS